jgi:AMP-activated protein kinase-like protein
MKISRANRESGNSTTGFGRVGLETVDAPLKPNETPGSADGKVNPQPTIQPVSERFPALEEQEITLTFFAPEAREVNVAGNFNGWRPDATPLKTTGAGKWVTRLMLRSGQYEYRFLVDGRWNEDPGASQHMANPYGGFNSVLMVPLAVRTSIL